MILKQVAAYAAFARRIARALAFAVRTDVP
jgi:hypothetical protein